MEDKVKVSDLAAALNVRAKEVLAALLKRTYPATINSMIPIDMARVIANDFGEDWPIRRDSTARIIELLEDITTSVEALVTHMAVANSLRDWRRHPLGHSCPACNRRRVGGLQA